MATPGDIRQNNDDPSAYRTSLTFEAACLGSRPGRRPALGVDTAPALRTRINQKPVLTVNTENASS